jgi:hypothetical protein
MKRRVTLVSTVLLGLGAALLVVVSACSGAASPGASSAETPDASFPEGGMGTPEAGGGDEAGLVDAGGSPDGAADAGLSADCATRRGGAFVTVRYPASDYPEWYGKLWITDAVFIAKAKTLVGKKAPEVHPVFDQVIPKRDCDAKVAWHVDPSRVRFAELSIEECDAHGGYIDEHLAEWVARPRPDWCAWGAHIAAVEERPPQ